MSKLVRILLTAAGALLCQCASGPTLAREVTVEPGDRIIIVYEQPRRGFAQSLLSTSIVDASEFYSAADSDPLAKVLSDDGMQLLLDGLATGGFFEHAHQQPLPGAISNIHVRVNDSVYSWSMHAGMTQADAINYNQCLGAFQDVYNATTSFHAGGDISEILEEHDRQRKRWEELKGKQAKDGENR